MNNDRFSPLFKRTTLLFSLLAGSLLLTACGGSSDKKSSASSSSSSLASSRSSFVASSVPGNGSGTWPSIKVEAQSPKHLTFQWSVVEGATFYRLFKHDAATGGVTQVGGDLTTTQATEEIGVHVHSWVNNYYYVEACNADGCQKSDLSFTATEMIKAIGYFKASNGQTFDNFGWSVALSGDGNTLAIGAPGEDSSAIGANGDQTNNDSTNAGAVYIFVKENGVWVQQAYLKASNTEQPNLNTNRVLPNDRFGYQVSLSDDGNTLAVSAIMEDSPSRGINCNQNNFEVTSAGVSSDPSDDLIAAANYNVGAVYVFTRTAAEWTQEAFVKPFYSLAHLSGTNGGLRFGESLALAGDGKTLAVGASSDLMEFSDVMNFHGSSFSSNPTDIACIEFYPSSASTTSTSSSSSSRTSSSTSSDFRGGQNSGAVYIFVKTPELGWKEESYLKASNAGASDLFGTSIAISHDGNTVAVGAIGEDSVSTGINGDQASDGCYYLDVSSVAIDATCENAGRYRVRGALDNGAAYVFTRSDKIWAQQAYLKPATTYFATRFGQSVALSADGNTLGVGAPGDASKATTVNGDSAQSSDYGNTGAAYIFNRAESIWNQQAIIKPSTLSLPSGLTPVITDSVYGTGYLRIDGGGEFGNSISVSQDGNILAVGSYRESSNAKGMNGDEGDTSLTGAGAVFVFKRDNSMWSQQNYVKPGNPDMNDRFGTSVSLSGDGKTMAVGAHRESGRGYASASSTSSSASSLADGELDQSDNSAEASGAVYLY